jgi:hypothetical protein
VYCECEVKITVVTRNFMPFVKLDTSILDSTLWIDRNQRETFITALLLASPIEIKEPKKAIKIDSLSPSGFVVPPGWYGFVPAAGIGIINRAGVERNAGIKALKALSSPEAESRSQDFQGRRMVRVDGGFVILNYMKFRDRDYTAAERQRRLRERKRLLSITRNVTIASRDSNVISRIAESREQSTEVQSIGTSSSNIHEKSIPRGEVLAKSNGNGKHPPSPKYDQIDHDEKNLRKIGQAEKEYSQKLQARIGAEPITDQEFYTVIAEMTGLTVKRVLELKAIQRKWPEEKNV